MPKIHKTYPSFYNGVSEQPPELMLDNQCKDMINCMPSLVNGLHKRPPVSFVKAQSVVSGNKVFHTYDRGDGAEQYIFVKQDVYDEPLEVYTKEGDKLTVTFEAGKEAEIKDYLSVGDSNYKCLTVQDRTWIVNKDANVAVDTSGTTAPDEYYDRVAYYWLSRGSGDRYNPYNYAVYLNGVAYACNPDKPSSSTTDPATGFEDSDYAASYLRGLIDGSNGFSCSRNGSILKIWRAENADFKFNS